MIDYRNSSAWIETSKGSQFHLSNPIFDIRCIAYSLSHICRYTGHCNRFYSVAEHSILVADIMQEFGDPALEGLMHDAVESVLADVSSPVKALLPDYKALEKYLDRAMRKQFYLPLGMSPTCKLADTVALAIEVRQLMPSKGSTWAINPNINLLADSFIDAHGGVSGALSATSPEFWEERFLRRFSTLDSGVQYG